MKKSMLYSFNKSRINKGEFINNFDFINQKIDIYNEIVKENSDKTPINSVKVKHLKGKR